jgi:hypothetical protein
VIFSTYRVGEELVIGPLAVLAGLFLGASPATAPPSPPAEPAAEAVALHRAARDHMRNLDYELAIAPLKKAASAPGLTPLLRSRILLDLGISHANVGQEEESTATFQEALRADPSMDIPRGAGPKLEGLFARARENIAAERRTLPAAQESSPATAQPRPEPLAPRHFDGLASRRLRLTVLALMDPIAKSVGGDVGLSVRILPWLDASPMASMGRRIGARLAFSAHPFDGWGRWRPYFELRGLAHPTAGKWAFGGGAGGGMTFELGPGRIRGGVLAEIYDVPKAYRSYGTFGALGYQLDLI